MKLSLVCYLTNFQMLGPQYELLSRTLEPSDHDVVTLAEVKADPQQWKLYKAQCKHERHLERLGQLLPDPNLHGYLIYPEPRPESIKIQQRQAVRAIARPSCGKCGGYHYGKCSKRHRLIAKARREKGKL